MVSVLSSICLFVCLFVFGRVRVHFELMHMEEIPQMMSRISILRIPD